MSQENVELVRAGFEAFNRRDFEAALASMHDSIVWRPVFSVETSELRGKAEVRDAWTEQAQALDVRIDVLDLMAVDATRVIAVARWTGRGAGSGARVEQENTQVFTIEQGRLLSVESFESKEHALGALGVSD